jgi:membrane protease YdiL (CAAX protease family)
VVSLRADLRLYGIVLVSVFALQQVLQGYMILQESIPLPEPVEQLIGPFKEMIEETYRVLVSSKSLEEFFLVVLVVAIVPAIAEELLFRGLIQETLGTVFGGFRAAVIAGLVFAAYHLVPFTFVPLAVLGIFFGYLVYRSGNISLAIAAHFFNNFLACVGLYLEMNEDFVMLSPTGEVSPVLLVINTVLFLAVFGLSVLAFRRMTQRSDASAAGVPG